MKSQSNSQDSILQSVARHNAASMLKARQRSEQDLTDANDDLHRSNEMLKATFEEAATAIALADVDGWFVDVNRRFMALFGYSREELLRLGFLDVTHDDDVVHTRENARALLAGEIEQFAMEKRYVRKDG